MIVTLGDNPGLPDTKGDYVFDIAGDYVIYCERGRPSSATNSCGFFVYLVDRATWEDGFATKKGKSSWALANVTLSDFYLQHSSLELLFRCIRDLRTERPDLFLDADEPDIRYTSAVGIVGSS